MENVLGMIDKASNNGEAARTIYRVLVSMGYQVRLSALQAAHYGMGSLLP
jgi:site-specific DNA-cytosine methylase